MTLIQATNKDNQCEIDIEIEIQGMEYELNIKGEIYEQHTKHPESEHAPAYTETTKMEAVRSNWELFDTDGMQIFGISTDHIEMEELLIKHCYGMDPLSRF